MKLFLLILFSPVLCIAQLETFFETPQNLINQNLFGNDYTISNVSYDGYEYALGRFKANGTNIGVNQGVLLTTGTIYNTGAGPHGPNDKPDAGTDNGFPGDSVLSSIIGGYTYNSATIEFDLIPFVDTFELTYVFGSEEYSEYVNTLFNDFMVISIDGVGFNEVQLATTGTVSNPLHSNKIISVNNVNNGSYNNGPCEACDIYIENDFNIELASDPLRIQYDGLTIPMKAKVNNLIIGETYHITIAIADVTDPIFDSGLFIESCATCAQNVGIIENINNELGIYPNPSSGDINVLLNTDNEGELNVYDLNGRLIEKHTIPQNSKVFKLTGLPKGTFIVNFMSETQTWSKKIVRY